MRNAKHLTLIISLLLFSCKGEKVLVITKKDFPNGNYSGYYESTEIYIQDNSSVYRMFVPISEGDSIVGSIGKVGDSLGNLELLKQKVEQSDSLKIFYIKTSAPLGLAKIMLDSTALKDGDMVRLFSSAPAIEKINLIRHQFSFWDAVKKVLITILAIAVILLGLWWKVVRGQ